MIDGEPVDWKEIIRRAKEYGYEGEVMQTSIAAGILRKHGHTVEENKLFDPNKKEGEELE